MQRLCLVSQFLWCVPTGDSIFLFKVGSQVWNNAHILVRLFGGSLMSLSMISRNDSDVKGPQFIRYYWNLASYLSNE